MTNLVVLTGALLAFTITAGYMAGVHRETDKKRRVEGDVARDLNVLMSWVH
jgi:hypothetical protein